MRRTAVNIGYALHEVFRRWTHQGPEAWNSWSRPG